MIPGGVRSRDELRDALQHDAVAAEHHGRVSLAEVRAVTVDVPRRAYVSYRVGDRIFWTKTPVPLFAGETLLTDGRTTIRARCGNAIADHPMIPTWVGEPDARVFDEPSPPSGVEPPPPGGGTPEISTPDVGPPLLFAPPFFPPSLVPPPPLPRTPIDVVPPVTHVEVPEVPPTDLPEPPRQRPPRSRPPRTVPEPGTAVLLGGAVVAAWLRRRQRDDRSVDRTVH